MTAVPHYTQWQRDRMAAKARELDAMLPTFDRIAASIAQIDAIGIEDRELRDPADSASIAEWGHAGP